MNCENFGIVIFFFFFFEGKKFSDININNDEQ